MPVMRYRHYIYYTPLMSSSLHQLSIFIIEYLKKHMNITSYWPSNIFKVFGGFWGGGGT